MIIRLCSTTVQFYNSYQINFTTSWHNFIVSLCQWVWGPPRSFQAERNNLVGSFRDSSNCQPEVWPRPRPVRLILEKWLFHLVLLLRPFNTLRMGCLDHLSCQVAVEPSWIYRLRPPREPYPGWGAEGGGRSGRRYILPDLKLYWCRDRKGCQLDPPPRNPWILDAAGDWCSRYPSTCRRWGESDEKTPWQIFFFPTSLFVRSITFSLEH